MKKNLIKRIIYLLMQFSFQKNNKQRAESGERRAESREQRATIFRKSYLLASLIATTRLMQIAISH